MSINEYNKILKICHEERINASIKMILAEIQSGATSDEIINNLHNFVVR